MNARTYVRRSAAVLALAAAGAVALPGCAPLLVGGAMVGGVMMATDRRTAGAQIEDQGIEIKAAARMRELLPGAHVSVTSYNRMVLLTGEVANDADRATAEREAARTGNVRSVVNELAVAGVASTTSRSNDALLTSRIKASYVDAKDVFANSVKVVTERGVVHLMGLVTEREAARATQIAAGTPGVQKVVRVFEILTEDELARINPPR